jgi:hypothetical protein
VFPGVSASFPSQRSLAGFMLEHPRDLSGKPCQNGGGLVRGSAPSRRLVGSIAAPASASQARPRFCVEAPASFRGRPLLATRCGPPSLAADVSHPDLPDTPFGGDFRVVDDEPEDDLE